MNQKELTKTSMMISNRKNPLVSMIFIKNSALEGLVSVSSRIQKGHGATDH